MGSVNSKLAEKLKVLRGARSLYEVEQASGISRSLIRRYESGLHTPEETMLKRLAEFYGVNDTDLLKLRLDDLYPEGTEDRVVVLEWADEIQHGHR